MSKMRIESQPTLEAYIGKNGDICLKQETTGEKEKIITIPHAHAEKVINWLQILHKEHKPSPANDLDVVD